jgi:hypothetical protein
MPGSASASTDVKVCVDLVLQDLAAQDAKWRAQIQGQGQGQGQGQVQEQAPGQAPAAAQAGEPKKPQDKAPELPADFPTTRPTGVALVDGRLVPAPESPSPAPGSVVAAPPEKPVTGRTSPAYLKRLIEHFVTHEEGFVAVDTGCDERIRLELYPLEEGWTVFARYSGNGREERVDQLLPTELTAFAERVVLALLKDRPISTTIDRGNVLTSDSKEYSQRVRGTHHFLLGVGTQLRGGLLATADSAGGGVGDRFRVMSPMEISLGYRGKFEAWGVEALGNVAIGTSRKAAKDNLLGGHIDLGGAAGLQLHFLYYFDPRGLTSMYLGSGATFELLWFTAIQAGAAGSDRDRSALVTGGLNVDGMIGWEFLRASSVQFFLEGGLHLPVYAIETSNDAGSIRTWFPGVAVKIGVMF